MKRQTGNRQRGAFELIEEAVHLVRRRPAGTFASYYVGSLPFVLGLLYFWADMSRSPFAGQHLAEAGLGMALLFLWMKVWQSIFARQLMDSLSGDASPMTWRGWWRITVAQATLQPTALFLVPLASVLLFPFAWVYAFYQNVTVFGADGSGARALFKRAARQSGFWPRQSHAVLSVLLGFGFFVFLNWATVILLLPMALKTLFGIQSTASRSPLTMLNTTFLAVVAGLTYLSVDPLIKAVYTLRCFYGEALQSGADLKAELKQFVPAVLVALILLMSAPPLQAQPPVSAAGDGTPTGQAGVIAPSELDRAISEVLSERKYAWRSPRDKLAPVKPEKRGILDRFFDSVATTLQSWSKWLDRVLRNLFGPPPPTSTKPSGFAWMTRLHLLLYVLAAAAVIALAWLIRAMLRHRRRRVAPPSAEAAAPFVDLADENVAPDQLPEDGWTKLAGEFLARGELRLALRAFYLASLAHLAARNLVTIAKSKSNRDYERELLRRAHSWPSLLACFSDNVATFDRVWYGMHPVDLQLVNAFAANIEGMRTPLEAPALSPAAVLPDS